MKHDEIIELLPWYANQTLDENERREVETHLITCPECAREVESLSTMQKAVVETENQEPSLPPLALNRALAQIEDYERTKAPAGSAKRAPERRGWWMQWWESTPFFARGLIAAQICLVIALVSVAFYQRAHPSVIYITASGGTTENNDSARIVVRFKDGATEQEIRQLLLSIKGRIIDGPSAQNLYTVQLSMARDKTAEIERTLEILQQNQRVVGLAAQTQ